MKEFLLKRKLKKYEQRLPAYADDAAYLFQGVLLYQQLSQREAAIATGHKAIEAYYQSNSRLGVNNELIFKICHTLLELDATDVLAHQTLGQEYCGLGEFETAAKLYVTLGATLAKTGRYEEALSQYQNVLVLFPDDIKVRQNCFLLLWKLHRKEDAVQELKRIAEIAERKGQVAKSVECYRKAIKIMPSRTEFHQELRRLLHSHRQGENQLRLVVNNHG